MTEQQPHTPAPWMPEGPLDNIHIVRANEPHMRVCFLTSDGPTKANAYLIAAAPDMLAALNEAEFFFSEDFPNGPDGEAVATPRYREAYRAILAAINKAQGRR